jgi:multiple sugar transport system ATP-binding protein
VVLNDGAVTLPLPAERKLDGAADGMNVILGLRPEHVGRASGPLPAPGEARLEAGIELLQPTGSRTYVTIRIAGMPVMAELEAHDVTRPGGTITVDINLNRASLFDAATERAIPAG